jgi:phosphate/sulfate permease
MMTKQKRTRCQILGLISLTLIIATVSYGFATGNSDTPRVGGLFSASYGVISTAEIAKISYILDETQPTSFTAVKFTADGAEAGLQAGVSGTKDGKVVWAEECEKVGAFWKCTFGTSVDVFQADWLHVVPD